MPLPFLAAIAIALPAPNPYPNVSVASWFDDSGATACGTHYVLGVANKFLACGSKITFKYGSRIATARVEDRGPFVAGRDWDLNPGLRDALACPDLCTVHWRYGPRPKPRPARYTWRRIYLGGP